MFGLIRVKDEHVFRMMKCQFDYHKVRYRGITKNGAQAFSLLALANLFLPQNARVRVTKTRGEYPHDISNNRQTRRRQRGPLMALTLCRNSDAAQSFFNFKTVSAGSGFEAI